jgi:mono/diheme cytochrome c family protein
MRTTLFAGALAIATSLALSAASFEADSKRGAALFREQMCTNCHRVGGEGARLAPDLGQRLDRNYTPAGITSLMWNHAPVMWAAMHKQGIKLPQLSESQAADLFAYFYSAHFFEKPGEAQRGKALFASKQCAGCHALTPGTATVGPPVSQWEALSAPIILIQKMWEHAPQMRKAMEARQIKWPELTSQDMTDLLVYLQNLPQTRNTERFLTVPAPEGGEELFHSKGCAKCHQNAKAFENLIGDSTLTDVAAAMWNHAPLMMKDTGNLPGPISVPEMRQIISYVWARQFFSTRGDSARGRKVFESQKCASCHNPSGGAPEIDRSTGPYSAVRMVSVLWKHGPAMAERMQQKKINWPQLSPADMANVIAYLNNR